MARLQGHAAKPNVIQVSPVLLEVVVVPAEPSLQDGVGRLEDRHKKNNNRTATMRVAGKIVRLLISVFFFIFFLGDGAVALLEWRGLHVA